MTEIFGKLKINSVLSALCFSLFQVSVFEGSKSSIDPELGPVFVGTVRVLSAGFSSLIMKRASRKILFTVCIAVLAVGNVLLATFALLKSRQEEDGGGDDSTTLDQFGWLPLVVVIGILLVHALGVSPIIMLLAGETYPADIRF